MKELPPDIESRSGEVRQLAHRSKALLKQLARISLEMAQLVVATDGDDHDNGVLPDWFMVEIARDLPRIVVK
jgi:hypothetical protein